MESADNYNGYTIYVFNWDLYWFSSQKCLIFFKNYLELTVKPNGNSYECTYFITCFDLVKSRAQNQNEVLSKLENRKWTKDTIQCCFNCWQIENTTLPRQQGCRKRGAGGASTHPVFDRPVNPISTWGVHYAHHITMLPGFSDLATALTSNQSVRMQKWYRK